MPASKKLVLDVGERDGQCPKQEEFVMDDKTRFLLWRGGRGCSKTTSGWARMLRRRWDYPSTRGLILAPDYPKLEKGVLRTILEWTNWDHIASLTRSPPLELVLSNGSTVDLFTASDPNVTRSLEAHDIWFDEAPYCPHQSWRVALACNRLLSPKGMINTMWATGTPRGYDWTYNVFGEEGKRGYKVFVSSIYENRKHLPKEMIENLEEEYKGTDFEEQELLGKYTLFEGLVYPQFDQGNLWIPVGTPTFPIGVGGIDLGDISPSVLVPLGVDKGHLWSPEEFYGRRVATPELLEHMADFEKRYNIRAWFCEATADYFILSARAAGFDVRPCPVKSVEEGIRITQHYFRDNVIHINPERSPNGVRELHSYQHKSQNLGESFSDSLVKADDHYPDALRYGVVGYELSDVITEKEEPQVLGAGALFQWGDPSALGGQAVPVRRRERQEIGSW